MTVAALRSEPPPVPYKMIIEPRAAGFSSELIDPSSLLAAASPMPFATVKMPGCERTTGATKPAALVPFTNMLMSVLEFGTKFAGARALIWVNPV